MFFELKIAAALLLDQLAGDPRWFPHPVKMIGWCCLQCERIFRRRIRNKRFAGFCTVLSSIALTTTAMGFLVILASSISNGFGDLIAIFALYLSIAAKDLAVHSKKVYHALHSMEDIGTARRAVSMIVGRDTENLDRDGICRACVETVAENMVDGVTAPLFFGICCSILPPVWGINAIGLAAVGAWSYKTVNTMDSMFGYKNDMYLDFGWTAAKLDDIVNYIPARLSGVIVILSACVLGLDWRRSAKIFFRDRLQHSSPNSAHTEAAVAGALGIQLGGDSFYFGKRTSKPTIGDGIRALREDDILLTNRIMLTGTILFTLLMVLLRRLLLER
jgi:adenosylcobinamide-phosphate synthase